MSYTVGEKLQVIMKRKGVTVTELARLTHQTRQNLSRKLNLNLMTVQELCEYGVTCLTIASDVIENLIRNANVTAAVDAFVTDFETLCGQGKTMLNCEE